MYSWCLKGRDNAIGIGWCSNHVDFITRVIDVGFWTIGNTHHLQTCTDAVSYWAIWPMNCWNNIAPHNTSPCVTLSDTGWGAVRGNIVLWGGNKVLWGAISPTQQHSTNGKQGPDSIRRCCLTSIGNPTVEIRESYDRLISTMGFRILEKWHLYIESGPRTRVPNRSLDDVTWSHFSNDSYLRNPVSSLCLTNKGVVKFTSKWLIYLRWIIVHIDNQTGFHVNKPNSLYLNHLYIKVFGAVMND